MVRGIVAAGLVATSAACQFPRPADVPSDASVDAPIDARPDLVTGRMVYRHVMAGGTTDEPLDLTNYQVAALIADGSSYTTLPGVGRSDGTFTIDGVPPGQPYLLKLGRILSLTDQHDVTFAFHVARRPAVAPCLTSTPVHFDVTASTPFVDGDAVTAFSISAGANADLLPTTGTSQLQTTIDWATDSFNPDGLGPLLPDATAGDDFRLVHRRTVPAATPNDMALDQILGSAEPSNVTLHDGTAATITATLSPTATTLTLPSAPSLLAYTLGLSPLAEPSAFELSCTALPAEAASWGGMLGALSAPIMRATVRPGVSTIVVPRGPFPDPFPPTWSRWCNVVSVRARRYRIPGATSAFPLKIGRQRIASPTLLAQAPMPPPTAIFVNDLDGDNGGRIVNHGMPVTLRWTGVSQATQYRVLLYAFDRVTTTTHARLIYQIDTLDSQVTLPAELLAGVDFAAFEVTAVSGTNSYATGDLAQEGLPGATASSATAMFRWSATCGDHVVDVGEDCDDGAATATCDSDCTMRQCGDGIRNTVAGELCDSIVDTPGCDSDCTANTCGDGHKNDTTEQCDDGNTMPGDGCSATCTTE